MFYTTRWWKKKCKSRRSHRFSPRRLIFNLDLCVFKLSVRKYCVANEFVGLINFLSTVCNRLAICFLDLLLFLPQLISSVLKESVTTS